MGGSESYRLIIKTLTKSRAKFLRFIPINSFVEREKLEISFQVQNISEEVFPGEELYFFINWTSQQQVRNHFPIPRLKPNEIHNTGKFITDALSEGFSLVYISMKDVRDEQGRLHSMEFYSGRRVEDYIDTRASVASIKVKSWEELYEFWALIVAATSLLMIALEKVFYFLTWLATNFKLG